MTRTFLILLVVLCATAHASPSKEIEVARAWLTAVHDRDLAAAGKLQSARFFTNLCTTTKCLDEWESIYRKPAWTVAKNVTFSAASAADVHAASLDKALDKRLVDLHEPMVQARLVIPTSSTSHQSVSYFFAIQDGKVDAIVSGLMAVHN